MSPATADALTINPRRVVVHQPRSVFLPACPVCASRESRAVVAFHELSFVRCLDCELIYKATSIDRLGSGYEDEYFTRNRAKYMTRWAHRVRKCRRQIIDCLQLNPGAKVLCDIGCSAGYVLEAGKRLGLRPIGVDFSSFAVGLCTERGFEAHVGSLESIPLPDASVDIITLKHTLEHVKNPLLALREMNRVLRPGGVALVVVPDAAYWKLEYQPRLGRAFRPDRRGWQHHVYFFEHNLVDAVSRSGFEVVATGKAVARRRVTGLAAWFEPVRFVAMALYTWLGQKTRLRREMQIIARKA